MEENNNSNPFSIDTSGLNLKPAFASDYVPNYGDQRSSSVGGPEPIATKRSHDINFYGNGSGFFAIWIVNLLLSLLTLGLYTPWARVRTRRYFYQNTFVNSEPFSYLADPKRILLGFIIVMGLIVGYNVANTINPFYGMGASLILALIFPFLLQRTLRFMSRNSAYCSVRGTFSGTVFGAYCAVIGYGLVSIFSFGLLTPLWAKKKKEFFYDNFGWGNLKGRFQATLADFYILYIKMFFLILGTIIAAFSLIAALSTTMTRVSTELAPLIAGGLGVLAYLFIYLLIFSFYYCASNNLCWNNFHFSSEGKSVIHFNSSLSTLSYMGIIISNAIMTLLTLGLYYPWAKVRLYNYRVSSMKVHMGSIASVKQVHGSDGGSLGDSALEAMDMDIGFDFGL